MLRARYEINVTMLKPNSLDGPINGTITAYSDLASAWIVAIMNGLGYEVSSEDQEDRILIRFQRELIPRVKAAA